jgi:DNA-binding NtrC family response regulator
MATTKGLRLPVVEAAREARLARPHTRDAPRGIARAKSEREATRGLADRAGETILLDLDLSDTHDMKLLEEISARRGSTSVVVPSGEASAEAAVAALRLGGPDGLVRPDDAGRAQASLRSPVAPRRSHALVTGCRDRSEGGRFCGFIGSSPAMQAVYRTIEAAAASKATVFISGESGTGKELCAEAIHELSPRRDKPFVVFNCATVPRELIESEMFGHVKGAFTGAMSDREGSAARAHGGTLFLDELCEMPLELQTKLLRFVQTGKFQKVGASRTERVDVRFVCATNRDPWKEVEAGRFREDLYYRTHVIPVALPPLRERGDDVVAIAEHLLQEYAREERKSFAGFAPVTVAVLAAYGWPGNVRQLQNVIRQIVVLNDGEIVTPKMLPPPLGAVRKTLGDTPPCRPGAVEEPTGSPPVSHSSGAPQAVAGTVRPLWVVERDAIHHAVSQCDGNVTRAAELLGISPSTVYRKRQAWEKRYREATSAAAPETPRNGGRTAAPRRLVDPPGLAARNPSPKRKT